MISNTTFHNTVPNQEQQQLPDAASQSHDVALQHLPQLTPSKRPFTAQAPSGSSVDFEDKLSQAFSKHFAQNQTSPNLPRFSDQLLKEVIYIALQNPSNAAEIIEKAVPFLIKMAQTNKVPLRITTEQVLEKYPSSAFEMGKTDLLTKMGSELKTSIQKFQELLHTPLMKQYGNNLPNLHYEILNRLTLLLDQICASQNKDSLHNLANDFILITDFAKFFDREQTIVEAREKLTKKFIEIYDSIQVGMESGTNITPTHQRHLDELQRLLFHTRDILPNDWEKTVARIEEHILKPLELGRSPRIHAIIASANCPPVQQSVITSLTILTSFQDDPAPTIEKFVDCYDIIYEILVDYRQELSAANKEDLVLDAYLSLTRQLLNEAAMHLPERQYLNFEDSKQLDLKRNLAQVLRQTPPLVGTHIELSISPTIENDALCALITEAIPSAGDIKNWIDKNEDCNLEAFEFWLDAMGEEGRTSLNLISSCEDLYSWYLNIGPNFLGLAT